MRCGSGLGGVGLSTSTCEGDVEGSLGFVGLRPTWVTQQYPISIIIMMMIIIARPHVNTNNNNHSKTPCQYQQK